MNKQPNHFLFKITYVIFFLFFYSLGFAQSDIQVEILGGSTVSINDNISISAGNAINFRITSSRSDCGAVNIQSISLTNTADFTLVSDDVPQKIKSSSCKNGIKNIDFTITNISGNCSASTEVNIEVKNDPTFIFTFSLSGSPEINVLGGSPFADINNGSTTTSATNGTFFGVVDAGASVTRNYIVTNTGSCPLDVTSIISSLSDFSVIPTVYLPNGSPSTLPTSVNAGSYIAFVVAFTAPSTPGTYTSTISISNNDNTTFVFDVSAEIFDFNIPGPGGVTADFRLWLKSTRGVTKNASSKVSLWKDIGTNGKDAQQPVLDNQPTFLDNAASNINFNPVIKFENDGGSLEQFMYNTDNGFYSQDMFIVMVPDETMTSTSQRNTIFAGVSSENAGDITGVGFGDYTTRFTNETLSYNQDVPAPSGAYNGTAKLNATYSNAGIINVRNDSNSATKEDILYNSSLLTTTSVNDVPFANVGYVDTEPDPDVVFGTKYWIGRNLDVQGSLNGRIAEIFTFAERVSDADRQKIESYLAIKYGITLGTNNEAEKDYVNSFNTKVWDITANAGYNYNVAGIGRDSISDLNQKQSKTINATNEVTIGLNGVFATNSSNVNEFNNDGDFLVWGSNNAAYSGTSTNTVTIASSGVTTALTRIDRKWKIVESTEVSSSDVGNVYVSIPEDAFSGFSKGTNEEYILIVADNDQFNDGNIIDVIPLKSDGGANLQTWYDFDGTKYFTFGKAPKLSQSHSINIDSGDYLVGEYALNLNINAFTISAWVKADAAQTSTRTIMAKGNKLQLRLNASHKIEVMVDDPDNPKFTSTMRLNDNKWHQITFVYASGTIFLYVDGVLDKSELNVVAPSPNYNNFSVGALYLDKNTITNPFLGKIDEVYIWDQALDEDQVRYLMNQEIEKGVGDYVTGKILPQQYASNEVAAIPWSQLRAYYDFNSFCGSTVAGLADGNNYLRISYLKKDKAVADLQTTPLPYISKANGVWDDSNTWLNGSDNLLPNALSLDGVTTINWNIVETSHDITSGNRDITLLGLISNSGTLTIADPNEAQDETNSGQGLTIANYLELDGVIDLVGESQLIQTQGSLLDADSGGYIERDQQGNANSYNYNYWCSSVGPITGNTATKGSGQANVNSNYTISGVLFDGTSSSAYQPLNYSTSYSAADSSTPTTPKTVSTYWMNTFYGPSNDYNSWKKINENTPLKAGEGFTMKGTSGATPLTTLQNYVFKGLPNNGDITLPLEKSTGDVDRLIGNPYPSAIDATDFILDNISESSGGNNAVDVFDGTLYFWNQFGESNSHFLRNYVGGYATFNLITAVPAKSDGSLINSTGQTGTKKPGPYIPVNQGFFVTTVGADGGTLVFKNSQRVFVPEATDVSVFLKSANTKGSSAQTNKTSKRKPLIRLVYNSPKGYNRQIAIGTDEHATNGFDFGYDAHMIDVGEEDMYWTFNDAKFVIQGVNNFDDNQEFALGLIVKNSGLAKIKLAAVENMDETTPIYIKDTETGKTFQINDNSFDIYLDAGIYNDRFKLVFKPTNTKSLSVNESDVANNLYVYYNTMSSTLHIMVNSQTAVFNGAIFNLMGQKITDINRFTEQISLPLHISAGAYIVQLNTDKGIVNKKVVVK